MVWVQVVPHFGGVHTKMSFGPRREARPAPVVVDGRPVRPQGGDVRHGRTLPPRPARGQRSRAVDSPRAVWSHRDAMIKRVGGNLTVRKGEAPAESAQLERDGFTVIRGALEPELIADLTDEIAKAFASYGAERGRSDKSEFRYEMLNRSAALPEGGRPPADPRGDRAAARRGLPRDRQHRLAEPARVRRRPVALRRRPARAAARRRALGRPDSVPGVRDRRASLPARLPARERADRRDSRQPPLGPAGAVRPHERRAARVRRPPRGAAGRARGRRRALRLRRVAPRLARQGGRQRPALPAGALRAPRPRPAHPHDRRGEPPLAGGRRADRVAARAHAPRAAHARSSTTASAPGRSRSRGLPGGVVRRLGDLRDLAELAHGLAAREPPDASPGSPRCSSATAASASRTAPTCRSPRS